jgi:hypothetical protein
VSIIRLAQKIRQKALPEGRRYLSSLALVLTEYSRIHIADLVKAAVSIF